MKRYIRFHKAFIPAAILSITLLAFSVFGLFVRGFNMGVDFKAGVNQYLQFAYPAGSVSYSGIGQPLLSISDTALTVVFSGADVENRTIVKPLSAAPLSSLAAELLSEGINLELMPEAADLPSRLLVPTYRGQFVLGPQPEALHRLPRDASENIASIEAVRKAVSSIGSVTIKSIGEPNSNQFVVRISDDGSEKNFSEQVPIKVSKALQQAFGDGKVVLMKSDYVGASFSKNLAKNSWQMVLVTLAMILLYAAIRFKWQFGIASVLAIAHDGLIMMGFMIWSGMEFNITPIAAILTILGYSINDTIVIFDRIREDKRLSPTDKITTILDRSLSETLGRTIITTVTTMLAVFALFFFTSGSIKDFALALLVGMVSGVYSTIFIASAFVRFWDYLKEKRAGGTAPTHQEQLEAKPSR